MQAQALSTEQIRKIANDEAEAASKTHALHCVSEGGPLHELGKKVDRLTRAVHLGTGALLLLAALVPIAGVWLNHRMGQWEEIQRAFQAQRSHAQIDRVECTSTTYAQTERAK